MNVRVVAYVNELARPRLVPDPVDSFASKHCSTTCLSDSKGEKCGSLRELGCKAYPFYLSLTQVVELSNWCIGPASLRVLESMIRNLSPELGSVLALEEHPISRFSKKK